jgi:membrane protease YdiL (CAAX protease family)
MLDEYYPHNKNVTLFIIITFSFSWLLWLPSVLSSFGIFEESLIFKGLMLLGSFGPSLAGFALTYFCEGPEATKSLWRRCWHWYKWYYFLISLFLVPAIFGVSFVLELSIDGTTRQGLNTSADIIYIILLYVTIFFLGGPVQEELGWRGYLLEHLQSVYDALNSSIILGAIWGLWHFPLFYVIGTPYTNQTFFFFLSSTILLSILFTWLNNNTNGSILVAMTFHASINVTNFIFLQYLTTYGYLFFSIFLDIAVVIVLLLFEPKTLTFKKRKNQLNKYI